MSPRPAATLLREGIEHARAAADAAFMALRPAAAGVAQYRAAQQAISALADVLTVMAAGMPDDVTPADLIAGERDRQRLMAHHAPGWAAPAYREAAAALSLALQRTTPR